MVPMFLKFNIRKDKKYVVLNYYVFDKMKLYKSMQMFNRRICNNNYYNDHLLLNS